MKALFLTTALVLGATAPVMAQSQLERSLGVEAGVYTTSQLAILKDRSTKTSNEGRWFFGNFDQNERFSSSGVHSARAQAQFARTIAASQEDE